MTVPSSGQLSLGKIRQELESQIPSPVRTYPFPFEEGQVPTESEKQQDGYFVCDIEFPSSTPSDGLIFETGGAGIGHWIGFKGGLLKARVGDGGVNTNSSTFDAAIGTTSSYPIDGETHNLIWAWQINPGRIRVFIDGILKIDEFTSSNGPLANNKFAGSNFGNYLISANFVTSGDPTNAFPANSASNLRYYTGNLNIDQFLVYGNGPFTTNSTSLQDAELGNISSLNTNSTSIPDGNTPHKMSEWYNYDHNASTQQTPQINDYFLSLDGINDNLANLNHIGSLSNGGPYPNLSNTDMTISFWFRNNLSTKQSMYFLVSMPSSKTWFDRPVIRIHYMANLNRFAFEVAETTSNRVRKEAVLHNQSGITGISNSSTGWTSSQRGNTNTDGFTLVTWVYFASGDAKLYWNDSEFTSFVNVTTSGFSSNIMNDDLQTTIGSHLGSNGYVGGDIDEMKFYSRALSSQEIASLWNSGSIINATGAGVTNNLITEFSMENNETDSAIAFNMTNNGGSFLTY